MPEWLAELAALCGPGELLSEPEVCAPYGRDWSGRYEHLPAAVVRPVDAPAVSRILRFASARGIAVVPQGGRTGFVGANVPGEDGVALVLSLERMAAVRRIDLGNRAVVLEAGLTLEAAQAALAPHGLDLPVDLGSRGSARIGGLLATAAGGIRHVRDGALRAHVRGMEAVLGDGRILQNLSTLEKNNSGYEWPQLLCASEGTLGVITAASIGLVQGAGRRQTAWLALAAEAALADAIALCRGRAAGLLAALEFVDSAAMAALAEVDPARRAPGADAPLWLLVETEAASADVARDVLSDLALDLIGAGLAADAVLAQDAAERRRLWHLRESLPEAIGRLGSVRRYDVAVPVPALSALLAAVRGKVARQGLRVRPVAYGHAAEGNVHLNMILAPGAGPGIDEVLDDMVYGEVLSRAGTVSAEHGIGRLKRARLAQMRTPQELAFARELKALCDPAGILNPGVLLAPGGEP